MQAPTPIHVIDFEGHRAYGVVEYGLVTLMEGKVVASHTRLCQPMGSIPAEDTRIHRLTTRSVQEYAPFSAEWDFFTNCRATGAFAAHNANYEHTLLKHIWAYPPAVPNFAHAAPSHGPDWGPWLDTCQLARILWPTLEHYRLAYLVEALKLQNVLDAMAAILCPKNRCHYHAALYDALAAALILVKIQETLKNEGQGAAVHDLYRLSMPDAAQREWDF